MKEIRDIKLDLLMGNQNPIVDLFCNITSGIEIINCNVYNEEGLEFIYHKDGQWIFYQDCQNGEFWCNYTRYWSLFESNFSLKYEEMQAITKYLVEEALKREVDTPIFGRSRVFSGVEEALKRELDTPVQTFIVSNTLVEEALKREVDTPWLKRTDEKGRVEEALKREVGEPNTANRRMVFEVEDALKKTLDKK